MLILPNHCQTARFFFVFLVMQQSRMLAATSIVNSTEYCAQSLCEVYNGSHVLKTTNIACRNNGTFGAGCGPYPKLLYMSDRRRKLLLDLHNLVRNNIANGKVDGYKSASHMPAVKWDLELENMAALHVKRCQFAHDECRNTPRYKICGQNIAYFWIGRNFKSHSQRMKSFVISWFREYKDANQSYIDSYHAHPQKKKIGHFTLLVSDRVHRIGCAAVRFLELKAHRFQFILTCNYDFNNIFNEPIYETGLPASKCDNRVSEIYPALCDWKNVIYDSGNEPNGDDGNKLNK